LWNRSRTPLKCQRSKKNEEGFGDVHSGKCDIDDVGQFRLVSWSSAVSESEDVVKLGEGVDGNRNECSLEVIAVLSCQLKSFLDHPKLTHPEKHPSGNTGVAEGIPWGIPQSTLLDLRLASPELPKPEELDDLLWAEES
jgi:hypothetical protein